MADHVTSARFDGALRRLSLAIEAIGCLKEERIERPCFLGSQRQSLEHRTVDQFELPAGVQDDCDAR
jgi:hypothetical protein